MKKNILVLAILFGLLQLTGCKKFLEVEPKSTILESELFNTPTGFEQALNGLYAALSDKRIYGDNLTMGFSSALSQNYASTSTLFKFVGTARYNYTSTEALNYASDIWSGCYFGIASANKIIEMADKNRSVLSQDEYNRIKGESLGLRGMLHFELLRLFAPAYVGNESVKAIPYRTALSINTSTPLTVAEVMDNVLADLKASENMLKAIDQNYPNNLSRRFYMNYLATRALQARAYMYKNDKVNALVAANEIIASTKLAFVTQTGITASSNRDRLLSTEQIFSIRVRKIKDWAETGDGAYYRASGTATYLLRRSDADYQTIYEVSSGGSTDYRYNYLFEIDGAEKFCSKYWQTWIGSSESNRLDQTVSLVKLPEMYLIAAESSSTLAESKAFVDTLRVKRGLAVLAATTTATQLTAEIAKEWQKEFYAEGQTFFYYKRTGATTIPFYFRNGSTTLLQNVVAANYTLPIPAAEKEFNPYY